MLLVEEGDMPSSLGAFVGCICLSYVNTYSFVNLEDRSAFISAVTHPLNGSRKFICFAKSAVENMAWKYLIMWLSSWCPFFHYPVADSSFVMVFLCCRQEAF